MSKLFDYEIRNKKMDLLGRVTNSKTLPNRYDRIKKNNEVFEVLYRVIDYSDNVCRVVVRYVTVNQEVEFTNKELEAIRTDVGHVLGHVSLRRKDEQVRQSIVDKLEI